MSGADDLNEIVQNEAAKPASTSIEGNSTTRRSLGELQDVADRAAANEAAQSANGGLKRRRFRHRPPAGGP